MSGIFEAYDIRGQYPDEINEDEARKIGFAFAQFLNKQRIVIARDMRDFSDWLANAFAQGIRAFEADVYDIGMATTPMLYYAIIDGGFDGGAMITASHLPAGYNGIKLCREKAIPLAEDSGLPEVETLTSRLSELPPPKGTYHKFDFLERYVDVLSRFVEHPESLRIVVDMGNGMGGLDTPRLFERLPN